VELHVHPAVALTTKFTRSSE